jgi:hypothetical protein
MNPEIASFDRKVRPSTWSRFLAIIVIAVSLDRSRKSVGRD